MALQDVLQQPQVGYSAPVQYVNVVGSAILPWDSSVSGLCQEIFQDMNVTTPFKVGRVARIVSRPMRRPCKSELLSQEEVESRRFVWNGNSSDLCSHDELPEFYAAPTFQIQDVLKLTVRELDIPRSAEVLLTLDSQIRRKFPFSVPGSLVFPEAL